MGTMLERDNLILPLIFYIPRTDFLSIPRRKNFYSFQAILQLNVVNKRKIPIPIRNRSLSFLVTCQSPSPQALSTSLVKVVAAPTYIRVFYFASPQLLFFFPPLSLVVVPAPPPAPPLSKEARKQRQLRERLAQENQHLVLAEAVIQAVNSARYQQQVRPWGWAGDGWRVSLVRFFKMERRL